MDIEAVEKKSRGIARIFYLLQGHRFHKINIITNLDKNKVERAVSTPVFQPWVC